MLDYKFYEPSDFPCAIMNEVIKRERRKRFGKTCFLFLSNVALMTLLSLHIMAIFMR